MCSERKIRIGLIEDQLLFRQGLKAIISTWDEMEVTWESSEGYSVISKLGKMPIRPDVLLVDLSLPPYEGKEYSGVHVTEAVGAHYPEIKIIILSVCNDPSFIARSIELGARSYLVKDCDPQELREAILTVFMKGSYVNQYTLGAIQNNLRKKTKSRPPLIQARLTRREEEILQLICDQKTTEEIAEKLFISAKTVDGHRNNLLQKTGARNAAGLVAYAFNNNIISRKILT